MRLRTNSANRPGRLPLRCAQVSILAVALAVSGCVDRTLVIRSDPPGAAVVVNGTDAGIAPARLRFEGYGTFDVALSAPRCHRLTVPVQVDPPWYERVPLDFVAEAVCPFTIHDEHDVTLALTPIREGDDAGLDAREEDLSQSAHRGETPAPEPPPEGK